MREEVSIGHKFGQVALTEGRDGKAVDPWTLSAASSTSQGGWWLVMLSLLPTGSASDKEA